MTEESSLRRRLPAGIVDTGFSSLATFIIGLTAVVRFDDVDRGAYALFFAAYGMGELIANEWIFTPAEVEAVSTPLARRLALLPRSLRLGLGPCLVGSLSSIVAFALTISYADFAVAAGLAVTSGLLIFLSTMQSHMRRMLHIAARSTVAAAMSAVQFAVVLATVWIGTLAGLPLPWLPFGALALANAVSMGAGGWIERRRLREQPPLRFEFRQLSVRGFWFVLNGAASAIGAFLVAVAIHHMQGILRKMTVRPSEPVEYTLRVGDEAIPLNPVIEKTVSLSFTGEIICIGCGRKTRKSFAQGYCYPCFQDSPECAPCIIRPEQCQAHEGIGRDMEWERKHHLQEHIVYLTHTGTVKVGVTRSTNVPARWIDQGATMAMVPASCRLVFISCER